VSWTLSVRASSSMLAVRLGANLNPTVMSKTNRPTDVDANTSKIENAECCANSGMHNNTTNSTLAPACNVPPMSALYLPWSINERRTLITLTQALDPNAMLPARHTYHIIALGRGACSVWHRKLRSSMPIAEEREEKPQRRSKWQRLSIKNIFINGIKV
jgi:hypothetical protein